MDLIEKFIVNNKSDPWEAVFTTTDGDEVNMKKGDLVLFILAPFGDLFMRSSTYFNGSLDKIYLFIISTIASGVFFSNLVDIFHPRWLTYTIASYLVMCIFNLPSALLGYYGKIHKVPDTEKVIDFWILIPIIIRLAIGLLIIPLYMGFPEVAPYLIHLTLFWVLMFTNFIHLAKRKQCSSKNNKNHGKRFAKVLIDTLMQYGIIFVIIGFLLKLQIVEGGVSLFSTKVKYFGNVGEIILMLGWMGGALIGYIINNMIDINFGTKFQPPYDNDDTCKGEIEKFHIVFVVLFIVASTIYFVYQTRYSNPMNFLSTQYQNLY
uniref:Uncharacterized protein n=1 Tax=viral metagenome TaxID=1070528 RepID=A0A6C0HUP2_9ZZZZ